MFRGLLSVWLFWAAVTSGSAHAYHSPHSHDGPSFEEPESDALTPVEDEDRAVQNWKEFFERVPIPQSKWGIVLGGVRPVARSAEKLLVPASTLKVVTAIAALQLLGGDFRFKNRFDGNLNPVTGVLEKPELFLSGDPTWGHGYYDGSVQRAEVGIYEKNRKNRIPIYDGDVEKRVTALAGELKSLGVKSIRGPIRFNNLSPRLERWKRPPEQDDRAWRSRWRTECYAAIPLAATVNGNCGLLKITGYKSAEWLTPGLTAKLQVNLRKSSDPIRIEPVYDEREFIVGYRLTGGLPPRADHPNRVLALPVHSGEEWLERLAAVAFKKAGICYSGRSMVLEPDCGEEPRLNLREFSVLTSLQPSQRISVDLSSPELRDLIIPFIQHSLNIVGDRIFLELAYRYGQDDAEGIVHETIREITQNKANLDGVRITDGSGLRLDNEMRPSVFKVLLSAVVSRPYFQDFFRSLSVSGTPGTGTLSGRLSNDFTRGRIFGKTGYVNGVNNIIGYFQKPDGLLVPFVILAQDSSITPQISKRRADVVLIEFARQNLGLGAFSMPVSRVAKIARLGSAPTGRSD